MATVFTPEHSSLDALFAALTTYRIPAYQRPYCWQAVGKSDQDSQVIQMWEDLWSFFEDNRHNTKEYFLGSMVIVQDPSKVRTYEVIDGQQRLTTLLLLFVAMRCFLEELERMASGEESDRAVKRWLARTTQRLESFIYNQEGPSMLTPLKLKIERAIGANYNEILERVAACGDDGGVAKLEKKYREIAQRYFRNRDYFLGCLRQSFLPEGAEDIARLDLQRIDDFFAFISVRVAIVVIKTTDFSTAYRIFEILNNRGLPLSNVDLLRNFVLERLAEARIPSPDERWERLEARYTFPEDFINRWIESITAAQPQTSAFSDAQRLFDERYQDSATEKKIEIFYRDLEQNLAWYNLIIEEEQRIDDIGIRNAVTFIKLLGNERHSIDLILALFRSQGYGGAAHPEIAAFLGNYRAHALHVILVGRFSSARIYEAIKAVNEGRLADAQRLFTLGDTERQAMARFFDAPIEKNEHAKLLLAACVWKAEEDAPDVVTQHLAYDKATLEHVIPQSPATGTGWLTDFDDQFRADFTYRLGNMTLLTQSKNSANRNFDFSVKRQVYARSKLPMTVELGAQAQLTRPYLEERHRRIVAQLRDIFLA